MILIEGGNVFSDVGPIKRGYVPGLIKEIQKLLPTEITVIPNIGSAGFKVESGDMDVFIDAASVISYFNAKDEKAARAALKSYIEKKGFQSALSGRNVHVRMPTPEDTYVQVDLMIIPDAAKVAPFHQHGPSGQYNDPSFKGGQLFILYSSIAKALGLKFSPFEGKLIDRATNEVVADTKDQVAKLLLNPNATAADLANVKTIMNALANDPMKDAKLAQAKEDQAKGLITLPESIQFGSPAWFRHLTNIISKPAINEDRNSMLKYISEHCREWDIRQLVDEFDKLAESPVISWEWKDRLHDLTMRTINALNKSEWRSKFRGDPDLWSLREEYFTLADEMRTWYVLRG
jgi:hypothetical protein